MSNPNAHREPAGTRVNRAGATTAADSAEPQLRAVLYDADHDDRELALDAIDVQALSPRQLLWIDLDAADNDAARDTLLALTRQLQLGAQADGLLQAVEAGESLQNYGDWFFARVVAVEHEGKLRFSARPLGIVCGRNFVLSVHHGPLPFLDTLRDRERAETRIGSLDAESFTASLLDWAVDTYLNAVTDFEAAVDRLEVGVLSNDVDREHLPALAQLRRSASRLRRMLTPQRHLFNAMARPDFRPDADAVVNQHFQALQQHFERAVDAVENARELVVGSFELFTTRSAERTNNTMRALTFFTVLLGSLAVVTGAFGMNFRTPFFDTGDRGFWTAIGVMAVIVVSAITIARRRRWF
jgi:magnesium transporter